MIPIRSSNSITSPILTSFAFSPSLRNGIIRTLEGSRSPNAFSGGISIFSGVSILDSSKASSKPFSTQPSPTPNKRGSYFLFGS